jgi:hypothetical protein
MLASMLASLVQELPIGLIIYFTSIRNFPSLYFLTCPDFELSIHLYYTFKDIYYTFKNSQLAS